MKLVMIEMMGGTRSFVGTTNGEYKDGFIEYTDVVEIKEILAPGPNGPACYHIGVKLGTMRLGQTPAVSFELDPASPIMSCYNTTMNQAIEKPTGGQILHYSGKTH
jgi:hypothetical protein